MLLLEIFGEVCFMSGCIAASLLWIFSGNSIHCCVLFLTYQSNKPMVIWRISCPHRPLAVPAGRLWASYVCCGRPASPSPDASPPDFTQKKRWGDAQSQPLTHTSCQNESSNTTCIHKYTRHTYLCKKNKKFYIKHLAAIRPEKTDNTSIR